MMKKNITNKLNNLWILHNTNIVLFLLLIIFMAYAFFIAFNLQPGIIPDEPAHFVFSKHYSSTWEIPPDVPETYTLGWYIEQHPFLFHWINGRILNLIELVAPSITDWQMLVILRLVNSLYSLGTLLFCYLLSKEIIKHKWWQLLPVFLLSNTLMFVFLSGGVNYDNLANFFSMVSLFFLVRVLNHRSFLPNTLGWMISISAGTLVKYPILPLALAMSIIWVFYIIKNHRLLFPLKISGKWILPLGLLLSLLILSNLFIYGKNLVRYQSITPQCIELLSEDQCSNNPYVERHTLTALEEKLSIKESIQLGYPDPVSYIFNSWIPNMFYRIFGILGHLSYFPVRIMIYYRLLLYWMILLIVKYWKQPTYTTVSLIGIFLFYSFVLLYINYNSELVYGFKQIAIQGRYIFPVIGIAYVLFTYFLMKVPNKLIQKLTTIITLGLFLIGGPIKFILYYDSIFSQWFFR